MEEIRTLLLVDMNSFFASCHVSVNPSLRNKPVIVGGSVNNKRKGLVIACSYEAKRAGIYTTQSAYEARKICPEAIFVQRDHPLYQSISSKIMKFLRLIGPTEVASIDEAYVDVTDRAIMGTHPILVARYIQKTLWDKIQIPCSIGIGPNKIIAKSASEIKKPMGIVQMGVKQFMTYFHPQLLSKLYGCGEATEERLNKHGINTIGDLARTEIHILKSLLGKRGEQLNRYAKGISSNQVDADREKGEKTIGKETTFAEETSLPTIILETVQRMCLRLALDLQEKDKRARTVSLVYKTERTGRSHSKSLTLPDAANQSDTLYQAIQTLYRECLYETPLWLIGVRLSNLEERNYEQMTLNDLLFSKS